MGRQWLSVLLLAMFALTSIRAEDRQEVETAAGSPPRAQAAPASQTQAAAARRSVWDGVYTVEQAMRGQMEYQYSCGRCHLDDLQGDSSRDVPPLTDESFLKEWNGRTVNDLFDLASKTMPADGPASLKAKSYVDILAYLLKMNKFPAGREELDLERLDRIVFENVSPGTGK